MTITFFLNTFFQIWLRAFVELGILGIFLAYPDQFYFIYVEVIGLLVNKSRAKNTGQNFLHQPRSECTVSIKLDFI